MIWLTLPFILQGLSILVDELYFHRRRGLPLWERNGHPIDTLSVVLCYLMLVFSNPNPINTKIYIGLCIFSCVLITKDEFVHTEECDAWEQWLHSLLFILHPITFLCAYIIWSENLSPLFLRIQLVLLTIVMFYQFIYWRYFGKNQQRPV